MSAWLKKIFGKDESDEFDESEEILRELEDAFKKTYYDQQNNSENNDNAIIYNETKEMSEIKVPKDQLFENSFGYDSEIVKAEVDIGIPEYQEEEELLEEEEELLEEEEELLEEEEELLEEEEEEKSIFESVDIELDSDNILEEWYQKQINRINELEVEREKLQRQYEELKRQRRKKF